MALLRDMQASGLWLTQAQAIGGSVESGITAAGSTQATAYQLTRAVSNVTTAAASTGVLVPAGCSMGDTLVIRNGGANALTVYPQGSSTINGSATLSIATTKVAMLICIDNAGNFIAMAGA